MSAARRRDKADPLSSPNEPILRSIQVGLVDLVRSRGCSADAIALARKVGGEFVKGMLLTDDYRLDPTLDKYVRAVLGLYVAEAEKNLSRIPDALVEIYKPDAQRELQAFAELRKITRES